MRIGLINELNGRPGTEPPPPTWSSIAERARLAEDAGFDSFVFEDAFLYRREGYTNGLWDSVSVAAALAATTETIQIGHSVFNTPYRSPAMLAGIATTLDEISGGRYVLGIGAGNTADSDYRAVGSPPDHRYSRFAEAIQIIHSLLKTGRADLAGDYYTVEQSEIVLRGPNPQGPPINIAAGGEKMMTLVAKYADQWNWWGWDETISHLKERLGPTIFNLEQACEAEGRDPTSIVWTFDLYSVLPPGLEAADHEMTQPVTGSPEDIAGYISSLGELGFTEVRCDLVPKTIEAIEAMAPVVELVHRG
jgi:alkanesulfonate monooxygenase SsuD/methylene tetrahydromethanopterin reductase-like flavin-dependent oxidoreductase (luciferase family)